MDIFIENSTEDDATVKVSPGGIGKTYKEKIQMAAAEIPALAPKETLVRAGAIQKVSLPPCPSSSCTVHFTINAGSCEVTPSTKRLKLTRVANNGGYKYKIVPDPKA